MSFSITEISNGWRLTGYTRFHGNFEYCYRTFYEVMTKIKAVRQTAKKWE